HEGGHRRAPAVTDIADAIGVGDARVRQVHLVELGLAGDLPQRAYLDAGRVHVDHEVRETLVLGHFGIGARDEHPAVGNVRERVPHLLTVDDPLVAVAYRARREAGEIGARTRLREQLAPDLFAGEHRAQRALAQLVASVR